MPERAVLYARVSTGAQGQADRQSLPVQREAFEARCAERGYEAVGDPYVDVETGTKVGRDSYQRMLADAKAGRFDVLVVTYLDRFGRDQWEVMGALRDLRQCGVTVDSLNDDMSEFVMVALSAWKADQESKRIGQRTKDTAHRAVREGKPMGSFAYGYRRERDAEGFRMVPDESQAAVVRQVFRLYVDEALSMEQIRRRLNEQGIPAPRSAKWSAESVRYVLTRRKYIGEYVWGETVAEGFAPLVDRALFEAAQRRRELRSTLPAGRTQRSYYLLSGIIYCAHCGGRMEGNTTAPRGYGPYRRYTCATYRKRSLCDYRNQHDAGRLEAAVLRHLVAEFERGRTVEQVIGEALDAMKRDLDRTERALADLPSRFTRNMRLFDNGAIASEAQLRLANQGLEAQHAALTAERQRLIAAIADSAEQERRAVALPALGAMLRDGFATMDVQQRKALLQELVERVECTQGIDEPRIVLRVLAVL